MKKIYVLMGVYMLGAACFFGGVIYIVLHFIAKFW